MRVSSIPQYRYCSVQQAPRIKNIDAHPLEEQAKKPDIVTPSLSTFQVYGNVLFNGYSSEIKRLYKKGKLNIKYSFYGGKLDPKQFSTDHIIPKSKGGQSVQANYVFCNAWQNSQRSNYPLNDYIDWMSVGIYLNQFKGVKVEGFDGDKYIKQVLNSIHTALKSGR